MAGNACWPWSHHWSKYEPPREIVEAQRALLENGAPTIGQRRECQRCGAVDYRRVMVHN